MKSVWLFPLTALSPFVSPVFAQTPPAENPLVPPAPPARGVGPYVVIETDRGKLTLELFPGVAPKTGARFLNLVQKGFYNGLTFHRVMPSFFIQGGDPACDGTAGSGPPLRAGFSQKKHMSVTVAMR